MPVSFLCREREKTRRPLAVLWLSGEKNDKYLRQKKKRADRNEED